MSGDRRIRQIAIVGGGTAGWVAASMLARVLKGSGCSITVIEAPEIGTVGVGEATIPPILDFLRFLAIDEADFIKHTQATYKLGIKFFDWHHIGHRYWHPFGTFGTPIDRRPPFHHWHRLKAAGLAPQFNDFSLCAALGDEDRCLFPDPKGSAPVAGLRYALHFDASLVARYLSAYAHRLGVVSLKKTVTGVTQTEAGFLDELIFSDQTRLKADFFIDCSGFRGVLIEKALQTGFTDWSAMLPCDRAVALTTHSKTARAPFTRAMARTAGWQWRIPQQHRVGNGYVYSSSAGITDQQALDDLLGVLGEEPLAEPGFLRFVAGRRKLFWNKNCLAIGLASGFLEPLESTSIHLAMSGVYNLFNYFPDLNFDQANIDAYNEHLIDEIEIIRDFIVLHYCTTQRDDSELWRYCRNMPLSDGLRQKMELYKRTGRALPRHGELFSDLSWFYIYDGMGVDPDGYDPLADSVDLAQLRRITQAHGQAAAAALRRAPSHDSYFAAIAGRRDAS